MVEDRDPEGRERANEPVVNDVIDQDGGAGPPSRRLNLVGLELLLASRELATVATTDAYDLEALQAEFLTKALASEDIRAEAEAVTEQLSQDVFEDRVLQAARGFEKLANDRRSDRTKAAERLLEVGRQMSSSVAGRKVGLNVVAIVAATLLPAIVVLAFIAAWVIARSTFAVPTTIQQIVAAALAGYLAIAALTILLARTRFAASRREALEAAIASDDAGRAVESALVQYAEVTSRYQSDLTAHFKQAARSVINDILEPSYDVNVGASFHPEGLSEVFNPRYEVTTAAKDRLARLLKAIPGGAIGLAGPRGSGKSTLMRSYCDGNLDRLNGREVVAVLESAPVSYEARDFVLHLFLSLCKTVTGEEENLTARSPFARRFPTLLAPTLSGALLPIASVAGILLVAVAAAFARLSRAVISVPSLSENELKGHPLSWELAASALQLNLGGAISGSVVTGGFGLFLLIWAGLSLARHRRLQETARSGRRPLEVVAGEWIERIRFQQSYSVGWKGELNLPLSASAGIEGAQNLSRNQLTFPEIVSAYRDFIGRLTDEGKTVLIGIDEVDKIKSDEAAYGFINQIKALFGIDRCYYLVSVSQSAMSSFERRGLSFRDAFDSSFDTILNVPPLDRDTSRRLIQRRIIAPPAPLVDFCFCASGGLARDLIRFCRRSVEHGRIEGVAPTVPAICGGALRREVAAKANAIVYAGQGTDRVLGSKLISVVSRLRDPAVADLIVLTDAHNDLQSVDTRGIDKTDIESLAQFSAYLRYAITLLEFFGPKYTEARLKQAQPHDLDDLASSLHIIAVDAGAAWKVMEAFRNEYP